MRIRILVASNRAGHQAHERDTLTTFGIHVNQRPIFRMKCSAGERHSHKIVSKVCCSAYRYLKCLKRLEHRRLEPGLKEQRPHVEQQLRMQERLRQLLTRHELP